MPLKPLIAILFSVIAYFPTIASADKVQAYQLANGLKLFVQEDHRAPVVVNQVWYKAGSIDEVNGKTGVAHVLEHMMFKGTDTIKPGKFSELIAKLGGKENAFTGTDFTAYFQQLEKSHLETAFKLEADRMANLNITAAEFEKEIKVVMEERRWRVDDKPHGKLNEAFNSAMFRAHPYGKPLIGFMNDLENMTYEDAKEWYDTWYAPNNATVVVVGDVKADEVLALAKQYFGPLKEKALPPRKPQVEPKQLGTRRLTVKAPAKLPYLQMGFHVPSLAKTATQPTGNSWEPYALDVLAWVLSGNSASRLNQHLVRDQKIALNADAGYSMINRGNAATFELYGTPNQGVSMAKLENKILNEIKLIQSSGVTQAELDRVKAGVIAGEVYQRDSMFYQAMQVGTVASQGYSWKLLDHYANGIRAVTAEQVQAVAKKYFNPDNMTVATLDPQPLNTPRAKH